MATFYEDFSNGIDDYFMLDGSDYRINTTNVPTGFTSALMTRPVANSKSCEYTLILTYEQAGTLEFYRYISSGTSDYFSFHIDDVQQFNSYGTVAWSKLSYNLAVGQHTFKWKYTKNASGVSGLDAGLITGVTATNVNLDTNYERIGCITSCFDEKYTCAHVQTIKATSTQIVQTYESGSGSDSDPFLVSTAKDLYELRYNTAPISYRQINDIDLSSYPNWTPINNFVGTYDGGNYNITGLVINNQANTSVKYLGLFGSISNCIFKNVRIINANISNYYYSSSQATGILCSDISNATFINCHSSGTVNIYYSSAGGLIGYASSSIITDCSSSANVIGISTAADFAGISGGLVGRLVNSTVQRCYSTGNVTCPDYGLDSQYNSSWKCGGLVGESISSTSSTIEQCYTTGNVCCPVNAGGLVGHASKLNINNCFVKGKVLEPGGFVKGFHSDYPSGLGALVGYSANTNINNSYAISEVLNVLRDEWRANNKAFIGYVYNSTTIPKNLYYNKEVVRVSDDYAFGKTSSQLKTQSTYDDWDFVNVWNMDANYNDNYPYLRTISTIPVNTPIGYNELSDITLYTEALADVIEADYTPESWANYQSIIGGYAVTTSNTQTKIDETILKIKDAQIKNLISIYFSGGAGFKENPYLISTPLDLYNVRTKLKGYFKQINDIDLSEYANWTPIGDNTTQSTDNSTTFMGYYNGNNFKITGLTINNSALSNQGLFGFARSATIENCEVSGNVVGNGYIGILLGYAYQDCNIYNCKVSGSVGGTSLVGGLIGSTYSNNKIDNCSSSATVNANGETGNSCGGLIGTTNSGTNIYNSYATGNVSGRYTVGGLIGQVYMSQTVSKCYATGNVIYNNASGGGSQFGGLIGFCYDTAINIKDCFAKGNVTATSRVGGLIGYANTMSNVSNCYSTGIITGTTTTNGFLGEYTTLGTAVVTNCYYNVDNYVGSDAFAIGKTTAEMKTLSTYTNWDFNDIWALESAYNGGYPLLMKIIDSSEQLNSLIRFNMLSYFKQTNDIDLSNYSNWIPIGNLDLNFKGFYDGCGFKIKGININRPTESFIGLFGVVSNSTFKNCNLIVNINGLDYIGSLFGYGSSNNKIINCTSKGVITTHSRTTGGLIGRINSNNNVSNCCSYVNIENADGAGMEIGGLIGYIEGLNTVTECYATGYIKGSSAIGGLVGYAHSNPTISKCYASGNVYISNMVAGMSSSHGGLCGEASSSTISNCYSTGNVINSRTDSRLTAGFIGCADSSTITNCYSKGSVNGYLYSTAFASANGVSPITSITNCYYNSEATVLTDALAVGKTIIEMQTQTTFTNWDFDTIWLIDTNKIFNSGYPIFKTFDILISTPEELDNVRNYLNCNYLQLNDINLNSYSNWIPIGFNTTTNLYVPFTGSYNGNNFNINNLTISRYKKYQSLFSSIKSVNGLKNINVNNANILGDSWSSILCGELIGTIDNCHVNGIVKGYDYGYGGMIGFISSKENISSIVSNCDANVNFIADAGSENAWGEVGGLIGLIEDSDISNSYIQVTNCYTKGTINNVYELSGGLIGNIYCHENVTITISKCYANVNLTVYSTNSGGFIGSSTKTTNIDNCYSIGNVLALNSDVYDIGGFAGYCANTNMNNCYSIGKVAYIEDTQTNVISEFNHAFVGLVDSYYEASTFTNCYFNKKETAQPETNAIGKTTDEMTLKYYYTGFDFNTIWGIDQNINNNYAYLLNLIPIIIINNKRKRRYVIFV